MDSVGNNETLKPDNGRRTTDNGRRTTDNGHAEGAPSLGSVPTMRPSRRFKSGDVILSRYCITGELGQGGMGVVYRCFDEIGGIDVALKAIPPELSHNTVEMEEVRENFQLVEKLHHPNIANVKTLEKDHATGDYYLIMECVDGINLRQYRKRKSQSVGAVPRTAIPLEEVIPVLRQASAALDYAHSQKILHRDIKPSNIMVSLSPSTINHQPLTIKVLDFGLASQLHTSLSRVSQVHYATSGTGPYMAPEQWEGDVQDEATDQYALAVVTYELLAGRCPFESHELGVLRHAVLESVPRKIPDLEDKYWQVLEKGLAKDREERFESCARFVRALELGVIETPRPRGARRKPMEIEGRALARLGRGVLKSVAALIVTAALAYGGWYGYQRWHEQRKEEVRRLLSRILCKEIIIG